MHAASILVFHPQRVHVGPRGLAGDVRADVGELVRIDAGERLDGPLAVALVVPPEAETEVLGHPLGQRRDGVRHAVSPPSAATGSSSRWNSDCPACSGTPCPSHVASSAV